MPKTLTFPDYVLDEKCAAVRVYTDEGYIHLAWPLEDGGVLSFEDIPYNYPRSGLSYDDTVEKYAEKIVDVEWIISNLFREKNIRVYESDGDYLVEFNRRVYQVTDDRVENLGKYYETEIDGVEIPHDRLVDEVPEEILVRIVVELVFGTF